jgi:hypothetical protein
LTFEASVAVLQNVSKHLTTDGRRLNKVDEITGAEEITGVEEITEVEEITGVEEITEVKEIIGVEEITVEEITGPTEVASRISTCEKSK